MATMPAVMLASTALARLSTAFCRRASRSARGALHWGRRLAAAMGMLRALRPALLPLMASTRAPNLHKIGLRRLGLLLGLSDGAVACRDLLWSECRVHAGGRRLSGRFSTDL